ncbi:MAG: hypothetical protein AMXMBFR47_31260 [Planctomycetota bacterium]
MSRPAARSQPSPAAPARPPSRLAPGLVASIIGALVYLNTLPNAFTYDDNVIIAQNPRVRDWTDFREIWLRDWWYSQYSADSMTDPRRDRLYRPLTLFTFAVQYAIHGPVPLPFHLVNVLLHALACWLVVRIAERILESSRAALIAGVLFAVHPIHVEAVANVVGRAEVLSTIFILLALLAVRPARGRPGPGRVAAAALALFAALLCKETAISAPAVAILLVLWQRLRDSCAAATGGPPPEHGGWKATWVIVLAVLIPVAVYLPLRYVALENHFIRAGTANSIFNPVAIATGVERVILPLTILGRYTHLMLAPSKFSFDYGYAVFDPKAPPDVYTALGALAALALVAGLFFWRRRIGLLAWMFAASYLLISNTVLLIGVSMAERLFYWPSVVVILALSLGLDRGWKWVVTRLPDRARLVQILALAVAAALGLGAVVRNTDWTDDRRLTETDVANFPRSLMLCESAARMMLVEAMTTADPAAREDLVRRAEVLLDRALEIEPAYPEALAQRAHAFALRGDLQRAIQYVELSLRIIPNDMYNQRFLAALRAELAGPSTRLADLRAKVAAAPDDWAARAELARALRDSGATAEACKEFESVYRHDPSNIDVARSYGELLVAVFREPEAVQVLERVVAAAPDDWQTHANLSRLKSLTDPPASLSHARRAFQLRPDSVDVRMNLAAAQVVNGLRTEALATYRELLRLLPPDHPNRPTIEQQIDDLSRPR